MTTLYNSSLIPVTATGALTARGLGDRFADVVNVKDFGAACDGVTDDTAKLNAMLVTIGSSAKTVRVTGSCYVAGTVAFPANVVVEFENDGGFTGPGSVTFTAGTPGSIRDYPHDIRVHHLIEPVKPALQTPFFPLGNDLLLRSNGPADLRLGTVALDTTSTTAVAAPGALLVTVTSTANFASPATTFTTLIVEPDGANEETIAAANWTITDATHFTITFANTHAQPFTIRQLGVVMLDARSVGMNHDDASDRPVKFLDRNNNAILTIPNDTSGTFPLSAFQFLAILTGALGANSDLVLRMALAASVIKVLNAANTAVLLQLDNNGALTLSAGIGPGTPAGVGQAGRIYMGAGVPNNANGNDNDFYLRGDGTHAGTTCIYHKEAGAWVSLGV